MNQPWGSDFTLDHSAVLKLARRCRLTGTPAVLGAGWDYETFVCDETVMRIPKRRSTADALASELALLLKLPNDLPLPVPRPRAELAAVDGIPYAAMVYPLLKGTQLCALPDTVKLDATVFGQQMGQFLRALHNQPMDEDPEPFSFHEWTEFVLKHLDTIDAHIDTPVGDAIRELLKRPLPDFDSLQVLCHMDLNDEHVLIDALSGRATAVIDWGDAEPGPWWFDFTGLWLWGESKALDAALSVYGRKLTNSETAWFQQHALIVSIGSLYYEMCLDPASEATRTWRDRLERSMHAAAR